MTGPKPAKSANQRRNPRRGAAFPVRICANPACMRAIAVNQPRARYCSAPCRDQMNHAYRGAHGIEHRGGQGFRRLPSRCVGCGQPTDWPRFSPDHDYTERKCGHCGYFVRVAEGLAAELDPL